jgi:hypothetical protein
VDEVDVMVKAGGLFLASLGVVALCTSPLLMRVNTDELGRLKSAVPPIIVQDYDGHGSPDAEPEPPQDAPEAPAPDPGEGASSGSMFV